MALARKFNQDKMICRNVWQCSDENHSSLGNIKLLLETLVQQRYLQKDKVNGPEGNSVLYELAERTLDGEVYQKIKAYVSQIVNNDLGTVEVDD